MRGRIEVPGPMSLLRRRGVACCVALLVTNDVSDARRACGISFATLKRWKRLKYFKDLFAETAEKLADELIKATAAQLMLMSGDPMAVAEKLRNKGATEHCEAGS
jgi:hypothetical protein